MSRWAYYSRNGSYSRSANAEVAEAAGRYPRTRAAKKLGVSSRAFDAGCEFASYRATEWHHVGRYASEVRYFDTEELAREAAFWRGAASAYKGKRRAELEARAAEVHEAGREGRQADMRRLLVLRRNCTVYVFRHDTTHRLTGYCRRLLGHGPHGHSCPEAAELARLRDAKTIRVMAAEYASRESYQMLAKAVAAAEQEEARRHQQGECDRAAAAVAEHPRIANTRNAYRIGDAAIDAYRHYRYWTFYLHAVHANGQLGRRVRQLNPSEVEKIAQGGRP